MALTTNKKKNFFALEYLILELIEKIVTMPFGKNRNTWLEESDHMAPETRPRWNLAEALPGLVFFLLELKFKLSVGQFEKLRITK